MTNTTSSPQPRICACVVMNHPYPANLPLLREIYKGRFSEVRFLIPFERMPDEDVITVYRGSYSHAAFITDAYESLRALDCDYYIVVHDDVLLNPRLSEGSFREYFPIGPDDAFIHQAGKPDPNIGSWAWYFSFMPQMLFPKSLLFGGGVEQSNVKKYLPQAEVLLEAMRRSGHEPAEIVRLDPVRMDDVSRQPSRVLLHGLAAGLAEEPRQSRVDAECLNVAQGLVRAMKAASEQEGDQVAPAYDLTPPIPFVIAGYFSDFYILPKSGLADFAHYMGVAASANLFVEVMTPTLLHAVAERVWDSAALDLDLSGFHETKPLTWFEKPRAMAMHPFKLSTFKGEMGPALIELLRSIGENRPASMDVWIKSGSRLPLVLHLGAGWHGGEAWGVWAAEEEAIINVFADRPGPVRLRIRAPLHAGLPQMTGRIVADGENGPIDHVFQAALPETEFDVITSNVKPGVDGVARLTLRSECLVRPREMGSNDPRDLGFALVELEVLVA